MYQKRYWTALKKNELSDADSDPINNWFFLHNNSPSCNVAIMGSFRLTGWLLSFVTHPICLILLQLTRLFPKLRFALKGLHLQSIKEIQDTVTMVLNSI
jgi:hypothetical protein